MTRTSVCPLKGYHRLFLTNIADCCRLKNIADSRRLILKLSLMTTDKEWGVKDDRPDCKIIGAPIYLTLAPIERYIYLLVCIKYPNTTTLVI